jgi:hypothetical protein
MKVAWKVLDSKVNAFTLIISIIVVSLLFFNAFIHFSPSECSGLGDCVKYTLMFNSYSEMIFPTQIESPFNLRGFVPFLAANLANILDLNIDMTFFLINILSGFIVIIFTYLSMKNLDLKNLHFFIFILWFFLHPVGFSLYYSIPISIDPFAYAIMSIFLFNYIKQNNKILLIVIFIGLISKESFLFLVVVLLTVESFMLVKLFSKQKVFFILLLIIELLIYVYLKNYFTFNIFPQTQPYEVTTIGTIQYWLNEAVNDPNRFIVWLAAFLCSTGVLIFAIFNNKIDFNNMLSNNIFIFLILSSVGYILFGLIAGSDMSRIIFNGIFFIFFAIFLLSEKFTLLLTFLISFYITTLYADWFPSTIEYEYYGTHSIDKYILYIILYCFGGLIAFIASKLFKKQLV